MVEIHHIYLKINLYIIPNFCICITITTNYIFKFWIYLKMKHSWILHHSFLKVSLFICCFSLGCLFYFLYINYFNPNETAENLRKYGGFILVYVQKVCIIYWKYFNKINNNWCFVFISMSDAGVFNCKLPNTILFRWHLF